MPAAGYEDIGFAKIDSDRKRRNGFAEVIFGEGKTAEQIAILAQRLAAAGENVLATRVSPEQAAAVRAVFPEAAYDPESRCLTRLLHAPERLGSVAVVSAGTADRPVAAEVAAVSAFLGLEVRSFADVGVAGLHRLLDCVDEINAAEVIICVAGMEGALVSVLGGLTDKPLLAVPSGVGYGTGAGGRVTLLAMLNSCASGVGVFNVGNGFGAAMLAARICRGMRRAERKA